MLEFFSLHNQTGATVTGALFINKKKVSKDRIGRSNLFVYLQPYEREKKNRRTKCVSCTVHAKRCRSMDLKREKRKISKWNALDRISHRQRQWKTNPLQALQPKTYLTIIFAIKSQRKDSARKCSTLNCIVLCVPLTLRYLRDTNTLIPQLLYKQ